MSVFRTEIVITITPAAERTCPGAPARPTPRRRRHYEDEDEQPQRTTRRRLVYEDAQEQDAQEETVQADAQEETVQAEAEEAHPCPQNDLEDEDYQVRRFSPVEEECRMLIAGETKPGKVTPGRVFSVYGAFVDFMSDVRATYNYIIEEPAIHVHGVMQLHMNKLACGGDEIQVTLAGLLPLRPNNLSLIVEGLNTVLLSTKPCFSKVVSVYIRQPTEADLRTGILPTMESSLDDIVEVLARLRRWGFQGDTRNGLQRIEAERVDLYQGYRKTREEAYRRARALNDESE